MVRRDQHGSVPHAFMALLYQYVAGFMHVLHVVPRPHRAPSVQPPRGSASSTTFGGGGAVGGPAGAPCVFSQYVLDSVSQQMLSSSHDPYCLAYVKASGRSRPAAEQPASSSRPRQAAQTSPPRAPPLTPSTRPTGKGCWSC
jgi:hypothetical protein